MVVLLLHFFSLFTIALICAVHHLFIPSSFWFVANNQGGQRKIGGKLYTNKYKIISKRQKWFLSILELMTTNYESVRPYISSYR